MSLQSLWVSFIDRIIADETVKIVIPRVEAKRVILTKALDPERQKRGTSFIHHR